MPGTGLGSFVGNKVPLMLRKYRLVVSTNDGGFELMMAFYVEHESLQMTPSSLPDTTKKASASGDS